MLYNNDFYLASAGAGKTTMVVNYAVEHPTQRVFLTTYTHENTTLLGETINKVNGVQPQNVTIMSWFSFLLSECIRPYQNFLYEDERIENLHFMPYISAKYKKRSDTKKFYLSDNKHIYSDKMSDFAFCCNKLSNGLIVKRLEQLFDVFILDEAQDISGWDFDFIELLLKSSMKVIMVGDVRQKTYSTSKSTKNKNFSENIYNWFIYLEQQGYGSVKLLSQSHRCIQPICNFADALFPELPKTQSLKTMGEYEHNGIFVVHPHDIYSYCSLFSPQILVYDKRAAPKACGLSTKNYGAVKGQTYERVLIIPTKPIEQYLCSGDLTKIANGKEKFYVAVTRARYSVAFLTTCTPIIPDIAKWNPKD